jgi:hypothetical protein
MKLLDIEELEEFSAPEWTDWAAGFGVGVAVGALVVLT